MPPVLGWGASMMVKKMLAAPAAWAAAVTGAEILPMDITIVMMDERTLFEVRFPQLRWENMFTHMTIVVTLDIMAPIYILIANQNESAKVALMAK